MLLSISMSLGQLSSFMERIQKLLLFIPVIIRIEMHVAFWKAERKVLINKTLTQHLTVHLSCAGPAAGDTAVTTKESCCQRAHPLLREARVISRDSSNLKIANVFFPAGYTAL